MVRFLCFVLVDECVRACWVNVYVCCVCDLLCDIVCFCFLLLRVCACVGVCFCACVFLRVIYGVMLYGAFVCVLSDV